MPQPPTNVVYLGIDPGLSGGIASIHTRGYNAPTVCVLAERMPDTEHDTFALLLSLPPNAAKHAVIEKVGGYVRGSEAKGQHGGASNGSAMFKFGASYGGLRMALVAASIPFEEVAPATWQKALNIPYRDKKKESKSQFKNRLKSKAQQLFPSEKVTLATADALLLAWYCREKREGRV